MKRFLLFLVLFGFQTFFGQSLFIPKDSVAIIANSRAMLNPFAGGLNFVQLSAIDLNGDGIEDLVSFDRMGNRLKTFLYDAVLKDYVYRPSYESLFPQGIQSWMLLKDYNCDGKKDLFCAANNGVMVFKNDSPDKNNLHFTAIDSLVISEYNGFKTALYVSELNLPSITDIDGDGDLDILTFDLSGSFVELHQNLSKETYGTCDSLIFKWDAVNSHGCWGNFDATGNTNTVRLHQNCRGAHRVEQKEAHSGSALLAFDPDSDGDQDLLVSCVCANNLLYLHNGGTSQVADMDAQDSLFPRNSLPVNIPGFPGAFIINVDHDSLDDIIASPNLSDKALDYNSVWFYKNTGTRKNAVFALEKENFLQDNMIDVGTGANPVFFDYDNDGDPDLLISNYGWFNGNYTSSISLYRNDLTGNKASFVRVTADFANISALKLVNAYPAFGDLDGDGDKDMILGESNGILHYFTNTAGISSPANYQLTTANYKSIDVGQSSTPQLIDVDKDGLLDLIIGKQSGQIEYYRNTGTSSNAEFTLVTKTFGNVNVTIKPNITGYSVPFLFNDNGHTLLLVGSESGNLYLYGKIDSNLTGTFTRIRSYPDDIHENTNIAVNLADIDKDGKTDLVVGTYQGGIKLYDASQAFSLTSDIKNINPSSLTATLFPSPANREINILLYGKPSKNTELSIFNALGEQIALKTFEGNKISLSVSEFPTGIYVCKLQSSQDVITVRFLVNH